MRMNIPGFNAESSLYTARARYHNNGVTYGSVDFGVIPQLPQTRGGALCYTRCIADYMSSVIDCGGGELCSSLAGQRLRRCQDFCELVHESIPGPTRPRLPDERGAGENAPQLRG
jgi:hypothetical protein